MAFAKYYWREGGRALDTGKTSRLRAMSGEECTVCFKIIDSVEADMEKGRTSDINPTEVANDVKVTSETDGKSESAVTLSVTDASYRMVDSSGKSHGRADAVSYDVIVYLDWEGSSWQVVDSFIIT
ncbi:hypothetical protein O9K63_03005 [Janibacter cremeus]|nr:DUF6318 family protein [Janibacter cremeus]WEV78779.1 hypothetical protein O9K63_03005 [Janibacter cremeus]